MRCCALIYRFGLFNQNASPRCALIVDLNGLSLQISFHFSSAKFTVFNQTTAFLFSQRCRWDWAKLAFMLTAPFLIWQNSCSLGLIRVDPMMEKTCCGSVLIGINSVTRILILVWSIQRRYRILAELVTILRNRAMKVGTEFKGLVTD